MAGTRTQQEGHFKPPPSFRTYVRNLIRFRMYDAPGFLPLVEMTPFFRFPLCQQTKIVVQQNGRRLTDRAFTINH